MEEQKFPRVICPTCGGDVPDDFMWQVRGTYFCSQKCAQAAHRKYYGGVTW